MIQRVFKKYDKLFTKTEKDNAMFILHSSLGIQYPYLSFTNSHHDTNEQRMKNLRSKIKYHYTIIYL